MAENPNYLPEEILIAIFSRLPAKAVGRCRCLSKKWSTELSTSQFVKLHLVNRTTNQQNLLIINDNSLHVTGAPIVDNNASRIIEFGIEWSRVRGCCNGLVLLENTKDEIYLLNPITLQHVNLVPLSLRLDKYKYTCKRYGLGYDSLSDIYKVVVLTYAIGGGGGLYDRFIDIYSVKYGAWKWIRNSDHSRVRGFYDGVFMNGAIHWDSLSKTSGSLFVVVIQAFDLANDLFREIPAPPTTHTSEYGRSPEYSRLLVLLGCLCMAHTSDTSGDIELWMMKQYGLSDSWTKILIVTNSGWNIRLPLYSTGVGEIVLGTYYYYNKLVLHNLKEGSTKDIAVDGVSDFFGKGVSDFCRDGVSDCDGVADRDGVAFVDSLVSPNPEYL